MLCDFPVHDNKVGGIRGCGYCGPCLANRRRKKSSRLLLESKEHENALFVTLTYSDKYLPRNIYCPDTGQVLWSHPLGCLDKRAIKNFLKRLRRKFTAGKIRVFYAGEYGDERQRPHYHLVIWGLSIRDRSAIFASWQDPHTGELMCDPDYLDVQEPRDEWHVANYVTKYINKHMVKEKRDEWLNGRPPEFSHGSQGLGRAFLPRLVEAMRTPSAQAYIQMHGDIPRIFVCNGQKFPLDRYLRSKLLDALSITEPATLLGQEKFSQEMQALSDRALFGPEEKTQKLNHLLSDIKMSKSYQKNLLEKQHALESSTERLVNKRRQELYATTKKGDF